MTHRHAFTWSCTSCALVATLAVAVAPARAQMVDHGALEQLFAEPVTTSATGQPQRASEAPANMVVVTADDIRRSGAHDLAGVLRHVGGVDILEWTNGHTDVSVRGYNREFNPRLLVLIDGRRVYADHYGFTPWNALPVQLEEIRQIEVVKGPGAALFGFNAVGGVINIVTYNPETDDVSAAVARAGTQNFIGASGVHTMHPHERLSLRLSAGANRADEFDTPVPAALGAPGTNAAERVSIGVNSLFRASDDVLLRLDASYVESDRNNVLPGLTLSSSDYYVSSLRGQVIAETGVGLVEATAYTNRFISSSSVTTFLPQVELENQITVAKLQDVFMLGAAHTFRLTAEYQHNTNNTAPALGGEVSYDVTSASGMWDWRISPSVSVTNAVRIDSLELGRSGAVSADYPFTNADWDRAIDEISFNSGVVWRLGENDVLRVLAGRGAQLPSLSNFGAIVFESPTFSYTGSPDIMPSVVTNYELVWEREIAHLNATLRASLFQQTTEDIISLEGGLFPTPSTFYLGPNNVGDSETSGVEIGLEGMVEDAWRWSVDYRGQSVDDDHELPPFLSATASNFEDTTPEHLVVAGAGWSGGRWEADGYLRYQSDTAGASFPIGALSAVFVPIDAYATLDGRVAYELTDTATLAVSGQNLGSPRQRQTAGAEIERRVMATLSLRY